MGESPATGAARGAAPRGRHAPPLEVRQETQRQRLLEAAASVFARSGYAEASAEAISREAGMSKATFYEHFSNKEECILGLFDAAGESVIGAMAESARSAPEDPEARLRAGTLAFLDAVAEHPNYAQTLLVEIIGAGPRAAERRDSIMTAFSQVVDAENARAAKRHGWPRFASPDDAFAIVGAIVELASRQIRLGVPADVRALEPVIERLIIGIAAQSTRPE
jgi:AcrR family transcriptional regulator